MASHLHRTTISGIAMGGHPMSPTVGIGICRESELYGGRQMVGVG